MHAAPLCPISPRQDLAGFLGWHRSKFGTSRMEGETDAEKAAADAAAADAVAAAAAAATAAATAAAAAKNNAKGYPADTPLAEMTDAQQAAYWKEQSRKHENTAKARSDYDELKTKAAEADKLRKEQETASEKAVREAGESASAAERAKNAPRLVGAEFRAAAKGVLTAEQTATLLEDLDLTKYLDDKGEVDTAKVEKKVAAFAPSNDDGKGRKMPDLGQGKRAGEQKPSVSAGREMFEAGRRKQAAS